jgi:hypothetical protein
MGGSNAGEAKELHAGVSRGSGEAVIETSRPIAAVARELGLVEGTLGNWGVPRTREVT